MSPTDFHFLPQGLTLLLPQRPGGVFLMVTLAFVALEFVYARLADDDHDEAAYDAGETAATLGIALGDQLIRLLTSGLAAIPFFFVYTHRVATVPLDSVWSWVALFLGVEFFYYWFHRASHRIRWLWATHSVHHSARRFNLSAALRLGWTGQLTGAFVFFLPLAYIGFHPAAIAAVIGIGLLYQFFLHTAIPVRLGPLEWVLNTPQHHRVHHASNEACLDRNYGSMLIIFDRLFGTFAKPPQGEPLRFGLKGRETGNNPFAIALGEWAILLRDVRQARGLANRLRVLFGTPG
jgi:sterol desaturase/sphingolipid hydroxylase (fatty acid hydroxylase superfamily)